MPRDDRFARIRIEGGAAFSLARHPLEPFGLGSPSRGMRIAERREESDGRERERERELRSSECCLSSQADIDPFTNDRR